MTDGKRRRILLTGGSGFVGSAVAHSLAAAGRDVALVLRANGDRARLSALATPPTLIEGDLTRPGPWERAVADFRPDAVAHLAWWGVKGKDRDRREQHDNVTASLRLYDAALAGGCRRFVGLGSQAEYGPCSAKIHESAPTRPTTVYGAAKLSTYLLLDRLAAKDGVSLAWLRLFSSYGPGDDPSWLIPYVTLTLLAGGRPKLTAAEQIWDYIYVDDVAAGVIALCDSDAPGVFNIGSGTAVPLRDIIIAVRDLIDPALPLGFGESPYRPDQVMHLEADIAALTTATGWRPRVSLDTGLRRTVDWFRAHNPASSNSGSNAGPARAG
ncbi:NAD(P)-dependent oxidoreductase [Azospirillum sp. B4]|uniref:NAD-dependent epimerase/dehydratase family protein n=1 Tax=Azospirillum sp. B4 TaxID=95605 RepID=UPI0005CA0568|nr:NAD(P)-dependent oxidoreductase [Azospirillum sp. B4]